MVACYRMSSQILNKVSRSTLLRQRCSQISTSQYRNGGGGGTTGKSEIPWKYFSILENRICKKFPSNHK